MDNYCCDSSTCIVGIESSRLRSRARGPMWRGLTYGYCYGGERGFGITVGWVLVGVSLACDESVMRAHIYVLRWFEREGERNSD